RLVARFVQVCERAAGGWRYRVGQHGCGVPLQYSDADDDGRQSLLAPRAVPAKQLCRWQTILECYANGRVGNADHPGVEAGTQGFVAEGKAGRRICSPQWAADRSGTLGGDGGL